MKIISLIKAKQEVSNVHSLHIGRVVEPREVDVTPTEGDDYSLLAKVGITEYDVYFADDGSNAIIRIVRRYDPEPETLIEYFKRAVIEKYNSTHLDVALVANCTLPVVNNEGFSAVVDVHNVFYDVFVSRDDADNIEINEMILQQDVPKEKESEMKTTEEIIIFANTGATLSFHKVTEFKHITNGFTFKYEGNATGLKRDAVFHYTSVMGYAFV